MLKFITGFIAGLVVALTGTVLAANVADKPNDQDKYISYSSLNMLHDIKINNVAAVQSLLEQNVEIDVVFNNALIEKDKEDPKEMNKFIILASVMNEKFELKKWRENIGLQAAFKSAQQRDLKYTEEVRCRDWSQSMWVGKPKC